MLTQQNLLKKLTGRFLLLAAACTPLAGYAAGAAETASGRQVPDSYDLLRYTLAGMMVLLLLVIAVLGNAVIGAGKIYWEKERKKKAGPVLPALLLLLGLLSTATVQAQEAEAVPAAKAAWFPADITVMLLFLALEFVIIFVLARMLQQFVGFKTVQAKPAKKLQWKKLFQKVNQTVALEDEQQLDLDHNYDGIRELDNKVPAWWQYAFYATILFSVVYLYRMFISETLPGQLEELDEANRIAAIQKEEYLKNAANNIDENNVVMLDASGIASGAILYGKNCMACHGDKGQGGVGPNLTDDYWLHSGGLKDVFRSIKYGWPEKGMKAWKDDFSPAQLAQLSSYVRSLHGTNPPAGKEPQGTLYTEATPGTPVADSTQTTL